MGFEKLCAQVSTCEVIMSDSEEDYGGGRNKSEMIKNSHGCLFIFIFTDTRKQVFFLNKNGTLEFESAIQVS